LRRIRSAAQRPGTQAIAGFEQGVEAAHAAEAAGKGDFSLAQARLAEQTLRQQQPLRLREFDGRYAEFGFGDPPQVPVADPEGCRQFTDLGAGERVFFDAGNGCADQTAHRIDRCQTRRAFGPATQAWPESRTFRGRRARIETHIVASGRARRTNGPAIDVSGSDGHEKSPVETAIAGAYRAKTTV
jgi:hypothetical protein